MATTRTSTELMESDVLVSGQILYVLHLPNVFTASESNLSISEFLTNEFSAILRVAHDGIVTYRMGHITPDLSARKLGAKHYS